MTVTCWSSLWPARAASPRLIETGSGGDPFDGAGWTGWLDLDTGFHDRLALGHPRPVRSRPACSRSRSTASRRRPRRSPMCGTETDQATVPTSAALARRAVLTLSSLDNRASSSLDPAGALCRSDRAARRARAASGRSPTPNVLFSPTRDAGVHREPAAAERRAAPGSCPGSATRSGAPAAVPHRVSGRTARARSCVQIRICRARCRSRGAIVFTLINSARRAG